MKITIPISVGELLDKISILKIKFQYTDNEYVQKELQDLIQIAQDFEVYNETYLYLLFEVNSVLWGVEDQIREKERLQEFDTEFIELARSVYITNDERSRIKKEINERTNSEYREVKIY